MSGPSRWQRWAALGGIAYAAYRYQPLRLVVRVPAKPAPWIDPDSERLFREEARITVVTAHPDDTEFYLGGTLLRLAAAGAHLSLIVATDGEKGYYPFARPDALRRIRHAEQREAAERWQAQEVIFLGHRDGRLRADATLIAQIARELERLKPEFVFLFEADRPPRITHLDHLCAGRATWEAMRQSGIGTWALHYSTLAPNFAVDVTAQWTDRMRLLDCHRSQWHDTRLRQVTAIITRNALLDGKRIGVRYAEGLQCVRMR